MKAFLLLTLLLGSYSAQAIGYVKAGVGYSLSGQTDIKTPAGTTTSLETDSQVLDPSLLAVGMGIGSVFSVEGELGYRATELELGNKLDVMTLGANIVANIPTDTMIILVTGFGITWGKYELDFPGVSDDEAFGAQVFAGMDVALSEMFRVGGEFRHSRTLTNVELGSGSDMRVYQNAFLITGKYNF